MKNEQKIKDAMGILTDAMNDTDLGSLAHCWHCNIAMSVYDECTDKMSHADAHRLGNDAASRFMQLCFGVRTHN